MRYLGGFYGKWSERPPKDARVSMKGNCRIPIQMGIWALPAHKILLNGT